MSRSDRYAVYLPYDLVHQLWFLREEHGQGPIQRQVITAVQAYVAQAFAEGDGNHVGTHAALGHRPSAVAQGPLVVDELHPAHAWRGGPGGQGVVSSRQSHGGR